MRFKVELSGDSAQLLATRTALAAWAADLPGLVDDLVIIAGELCSNAIRHGQAPIQVTASRTSSGVGLCVRQRNRPVSSWPRLMTTGPDESGGRGLLIVDRLSDEWGWRASGTWTEAWAAIDDSRA
ncbi:MAG: ATP-binding protein [Candidatus Nanopelagicales bacterium]